MGVVPELRLDTPYNLINLKFKDKGRYNKKLYDILDVFLQNGKIDAFKNRINPDLTINFVRTNKMRHKINKDVLNRQSENLGLKIINDKWIIGCPVICYYNDNDLISKGIYNCQRFKLEKYDKNVILERHGKKFQIDKHLFEQNFDLGYACTVYKVQGSDIIGDYNIYETKKMSKEEIYVALSRASCIENIHGDFNHNIIYTKSKEPVEFNHIKCKYNKYRDGKIYEISNGDDYYIGSTIEPIDERFKEHKENPTNKDMKKMLKCENVKIRLIENYGCPSKKDLVDRELMILDDYIEKGYNMLNEKHRKRKVIEFKTQIVNEYQENDGFLAKNFYDDEENKKFTIRIIDENNKYIKKYFRYGKRGKDETMDLINNKYPGIFTNKK